MGFQVVFQFDWSTGKDPPLIKRAISTFPPEPAASVRAAILLLMLLLAGCSGTPSEQEAPFDPWLFLDGDLARLAEHPGGRQYLFSSHDRTGGNDDGFSGFYSALRRDDRGEYVLAEMEGPGCVRRIWLTWPGRNIRIRFYIDGAEEPAIDAPLEAMFSGQFEPFLPPWVGSSKRFGGICFSYIPIPFSKSIRITTDNGVRFYQINVERLPDDTDVKSYERVISAEDSDRLDAAGKALGLLPGSAEIDGPRTVEGHASLESHGGGIELVRGGEVTFFESDSPGRIEEMRLSVEPTPEGLRSVIVSAYWDGEEEPSVRVPLADLFGSAFCPPKTWSVPIIAGDGCGIIRFPMPFESARLTLESRGDLKSVKTLLLVSRPRNLPATRFHALWREQESVNGEPVNFLRTEGRGVYVGTIVSAVAARSEEFLEGDETFIIDGSMERALRGTGTEDYFNSGWYFAKGGIPQPFHGAPFVDRENAPRFSAFRFHLVDRIPFSESIEVNFEHGDRNRESGSIYASVALWYQEGEGARTGPLPESISFLPKRVVNPGQMLPLMEGKGVGSGGLDRKLEWSDVIVDWLEPPVWGSTTVIHFIMADQESLEAHFLVPADGEYDVSLVYARGPSYDSFDLFLDGEILHESVPGLAEQLEPNHETDPIRLRLDEGLHRLSIQMIGPVRGDEIRGLPQGILLDPVAPFVKSWLVAGPFDNRADRGFDQVFRPEREHVEGGYVSTDGVYGGMDGARIEWTSAVADSAGYINLRKQIGPGAHRAGYGLTWCSSPEARRVLFSCGGDDGLAVWVNGVDVWRNHRHRGWTEGEDRFVVDLEKGRNEILVKVDQFIAGWGFSLRVSDPDNRLTFNQFEK